MSARTSSKQPNLKLKTRLKPVLGSLPLAFVLSGQSVYSQKGRNGPAWKGMKSPEAVFLVVSDPSMNEL